MTDERNDTKSTPSGGVHLITAPFDVKKFTDSLYEHGCADLVEIKHNCHTVLYYGGQER